MPTYLYRREDGSTFEVKQRITEPRLETCPTTGQPVTRLISGSAGLIFKGSGFYQTDYVRNNGNGDSDSKKSTPSKAESTASEGSKTEGSKTESAKAETTSKD